MQLRSLILMEKEMLHLPKAHHLVKVRHFFGGNGAEAVNQRTRLQRLCCYTIWQTEPYHTVNVLLLIDNVNI